MELRCWRACSSDPSSTPEILAKTAPSRAGPLMAGRHGFISFDPARGLCRPIAPTDEGQGRLNDGYCDPRGRFWAGTMGDGDPTSTGTAQLYRLDAEGTVTPMLSGVRVSNGIDWSPDERTMYFADTPTGRIEAFDYDAETGAIRNR